MALIDKLIAIADAIREKTGGTDSLTLEQMVEEIKGIENGGDGGNSGSDIIIGNYKLMYGQVTPTVTGGFTVTYPFSGILVYASVWIANPSVVTEKYGSANIMLESHSALVGKMREIHYSTNETALTVVKSVYGIRLNDKTSFTYDSHGNWPAQPETYNWIAVCEV